MNATAAPMLDLLTWIAARPRTYRETIEAWRSNCPRQPVWDDALGAGLVQVVRSGRNLNESEVALTKLGRAVLSR